MNDNYGLSHEQMHCLAEGILENLHQKLGEKEDICLEEKMGVESGDRFHLKDIDLLYLVAYKAIDIHISIANTYKKEIYARNYIWVIEKLYKKWKKKTG